MNEQLDNLFSRVFKKPFFWAKDSVFRILFLLAILYIFVFPVIQWLQNVIKQLPYVGLVTGIYEWFLKTFSIGERIILLILVFLTVIVIYIFREISKSRVAKDNFNHGLNLWSIPFNAGWSIQSCTDANGNMLQVSNSPTAGILKAAYNWYDYEFSFFTKLTSENKVVSFVIRAENSSNAIVFVLSKSSLDPFLLSNGIFISDQSHVNKLALELNENVWFRVSVKVIGSDVEIIIGEGNKIYYKIQTLSLNVEDTLLNKYGKVPTLEDLRESQKKWINLLKRALDLSSNVEKINDATLREQKAKEADIAFSEANKINTTQLSLDFSKGTVGFLARGDQKFDIRKIQVNKI